MWKGIEVMKYRIKLIRLLLIGALILISCQALSPAQVSTPTFETPLQAPTTASEIQITESTEAVEPQATELPVVIREPGRYLRKL
jgi:hypothetical protein